MSMFISLVMLVTIDDGALAPRVGELTGLRTTESFT